MFPEPEDDTRKAAEEAEVKRKAEEEAAAKEADAKLVADKEAKEKEEALAKKRAAAKAAAAKKKAQEAKKKEPTQEQKQKSEELRKAAADSNAAGVSALLQRGADPNIASDDTGDTALHIAAKVGMVAGIESLLYFKADSTMKNKAGKRPIDLATNGEI